MIDYLVRSGVCLVTLFAVYHLFLAKEINASTLNTLHNLNFYLDTLRRIKDAIMFRRFESFRRAFHHSLSRQPHDS